MYLLLFALIIFALMLAMIWGFLLGTREHWQPLFGGFRETGERIGQEP